MSFADSLATMDATMVEQLWSGETIVYRTGAHSSETIRGVFDSSYEFVGVGDELGLSSFQPALFANLDDLETDPKVDDDAEVSIDGVWYRIADAQHDGKGGTLMRLHRKRD